MPRSWIVPSPRAAGAPPGPGVVPGPDDRRASGPATPDAHAAMRPAIQRPARAPLSFAFPPRQRGEPGAFAPDSRQPASV